MGFVLFCFVSMLQPDAQSCLMLENEEIPRSWDPQCSGSAIVANALTRWTCGIKPRHCWDDPKSMKVNKWAGSDLDCDSKEVTPNTVDRDF